jgi:hypothetical protein
MSDQLQQVADKGDYYEITDGLPQFTGYDRPPSAE